MKTTTLGFSIAENKTMQRREGTITISGGNATQTITVRQRSDQVILDTPNNNEIYYTTSDYNTLSPQMGVFGSHQNLLNLS